MNRVMDEMERILGARSPFVAVLSRGLIRDK